MSCYQVVTFYRLISAKTCRYLYMPARSEDGTHNQLGYIVEWNHTHPISQSRGRVMQHRRIMYDIFGPGPHPCFYCPAVLPWRTGRKVKGKPGIEVDHLDGDRKNNDPINLVFCCPSCQTKKSQRGDHTHLVGAA